MSKKISLLVLFFCMTLHSFSQPSPEFIRLTQEKAKLWLDREEEPLVYTIEQFKAELPNFKPSEQAILHALLGQCFWDYFQANRYRFYSRTSLAEVMDTNDIRTWDLNTILKTCMFHFKASLQPVEILKTTPVRDYDTILILGDKESILERPTLYDLLVHQAVQVFKNGEARLVQPKNVFLIHNPLYFAPAKDFVKIEMPDTDSLSLIFQSLRLLQDLTAWRLSENNLDALIPLEINRLDLVRKNYAGWISDSLYALALENLIQVYPNHPAISKVYESLAKYYNEIDQNKDFEDTKNSTNKLKAIAYAEQIIKSYPQTLSANNAKSLMEDIKQIYLQTYVSDVVIPKQADLIMLEYANLSKVYFSLYRLDAGDLADTKKSYKSTDFMRNKLAETPFLSWEQAIPNPEGYNKHRVEVELPELDAGYYILITSSDKTMDVNKCIISSNIIISSELSYILASDKNIVEGYVLNRTTGQPISNVKVQAFHLSYDNKQALRAETQSDKKGFFRFSFDKQERLVIKLQKGADSLDPVKRQTLWIALDNETKRTDQTVHFFTDRSIYRPGQIVYFKGIFVETIGEESKILPNKSVTIKFLNSQSKEVSTIAVKTNAYGSFSGEFVIPSSGLNGDYSIVSDFGQVYIAVENYKRPRFEVTLEPLTGSYTWNQTVQLTGHAKTYAGSNLSNAKVSYRVNQSIRFPFWRTRFYPPFQKDAVVAYGETTTDENGVFSLEFRAKENPKVNLKHNPVYTYHVIVEITDASGETQAVSENFSISDKALNLSLTIKHSDICRERDSVVKIKSTNLSGYYIPAKGQVKVYRLIPNDRLLYDRLWARPDQFVFSAGDFIKRFPNAPCKEEDYHHENKPKELVFSTDFNTTQDSLMTLSGMPTWPVGDYVYEIRSQDTFGTPVVADGYFSLYSMQSKKEPYHKPFYVIPSPDNQLKPGDNATFVVGTADKNRLVFYCLSQGSTILEKKWIKLNREQKLVQIPITPDLQGQISVQFITVKHNRFYEFREILTIPYYKNLASIQFHTFRSKLVPNQKETWTLGLSDYMKKPVQGEFLVSMYDASLDVFRDHSWTKNLKSFYYTSNLFFESDQTNSYSMSAQLYFPNTKNFYFKTVSYDRLNWFSFLSRSKAQLYGARSSMGEESVVNDMSMAVVHKETSEESFSETESVGPDLGSPHLQIRQNFNETAFFYPHLISNDSGFVNFTFTVPESLTRWKFMAFAHTKDLKSDYLEHLLTAQKDLMVFPNNPRFLREGDSFLFKANVSNLSDEKINGKAELRCLNLVRSEPSGIFEPIDFSIESGQSKPVAWLVSIDHNSKLLRYQMFAQTANQSDGEENIIPVLSNRAMLTETMPLFALPKSDKVYNFAKMDKPNSTTLEPHKLTLEAATNPIWYAIQAIPTVADNTQENSIALMNTFYVSAMAAKLVNDNPAIQAVFETWKTLSSQTLKSNLERNEDLKQILIEETPWLLDAEHESEQKERIALYFEENNTVQKINQSFEKLRKMQLPNGGFTWYAGGKDNRITTQNILLSLVRLLRAGAYDLNLDYQGIFAKAIKYMDKDVFETYKKARDKNLLSKDIGALDVQYLYLRNYLSNPYPLDDSTALAFGYHKDLAEKTWSKQSNYMQAMLGVFFHESGYTQLAQKIMANLKKTALYSTELGMYWRNESGWYWYQSQLDAHCQLIEIFSLFEDHLSVNQMKQWLLNHKRTNQWSNPRTTVNAIHALLSGETALDNQPIDVSIRLGDKIIEMNSTEAGTGYFKTSWQASEIDKSMAKIQIQNKNNAMLWGGVYWQYFENLDKVTAAKTPLDLKKDLYIERMTDQGAVLEAISKNGIRVGDKLVVRIELRADRDMDYVHMKDLRAAGLEPMNETSGYRYQDGLGYYQDIKDASVNFFFSILRKGTYVFEYRLRASQAGDFSNGYTSIQCLYAPEFSSHSQGIRIKVTE